MGGLRKPRYGGPCVANVLPIFLGAGEFSGFPYREELAGAERLVLLVVDGLGALQLKPRLPRLEALSRFSCGEIDTVLPSTTVAALTSIATGSPPSVHGLVGYRFRVGGHVLNALRWTVSGMDARDIIPPEDLALKPPLLGEGLTVITRADFRPTGFTRAHLRGCRFVGWPAPAAIPVLVEEALAEGARAVYCYYDALDRTAHYCGLGRVYEAELTWLDRLVGEILEVLPPGTAFAITGDHGEVDPEGASDALPKDVLKKVSQLSGEARFRWLHLRDAQEADVVSKELASLLEGKALVMTRDEVLEEGWLGSPVAPGVPERLGDVAILSAGPDYFLDPDEPGEAALVGRHGSATEEEILVPFLLYRRS